ncbi:ATP-binding protein [Oscillatoria laete-virens NRMC-F 0139]|nr:ATP-binding protein [Oscillatoria laete-virens]MDL5053322.1 ATP-binding protein [Oscillatoria laete-virens NRMC-F 0139]
MDAFDAVRRMVVAHSSGDDDAFRRALKDYISEERRLNHNVVARDLEQILGKGNGTRRCGELNPLGAGSTELPRDNERGVALIELREPSRILESLVLEPRTRAALDRIVQENRDSELLSTHGLAPIRKILFCGPPGCGKTAAAEALAKELYLPLAIVRFDAVVSSYLGETAANLRKVFEYARSRPMVMLFDEFDAIGKTRTDESDHGELKRVVNSFLQILDTFSGPTLTIAATNHQQILDSAIWRRFEDVVYFNLPNEQSILELLKRSFRQFTVSTDVSLPNTAKALKGFSFADIERATLDSIKTSILSNQSKVTRQTINESVHRQLERVEAVSKQGTRSKTRKSK